MAKGIEVRDIKGYPGYQVSSDGEIFSVLRGGGENRKLKPALTASGYHRIKLSRNGVQTSYNVHRLVAEAFLSKPRGKDVVNHIDGDKINNSVKNLEWTDHKGNARHYRAKLEPVNRARRTKFNQEKVQKQISIVKFAHDVYRDDPEAFTKLVAVTFDLA